MYKRTIVPKIQSIDNIQQFNQQKLVRNGQEKNIHQIDPLATTTLTTNDDMQNGNNQNIFASKGPRRREEKNPSSSSTNINNGGLSYAEINAKRERIMQEQMKKMQQESQMMMNRYMDEAKRRNDLLQNEINMRNKEETTKQSLMKQRMDEAEAIAKARKDELKRQESLLRNDHLTVELEAQKRKAEGVKLEHQKQNMLKGKESQEQKENERAKLQAEIREREFQRAEERKVEEMLRERELMRIQNEIRKEQMQIQYNKSRKNSVDMNGYQTPQRTEGDIQGFGSAKTGIVSRRKLALLTRSNSVGPSDATDANSNNKNQSNSIQGSPMVARRTFTVPVNMPSKENNGLIHQVGRVQDMDDPTKNQYINEYNAQCEVTTNTNPQWSMLAQQTAAIANTDFANQTKALSGGLTRAQK